MKSFAASLMLFAALIGLTVFNYCYITSVSDTLCQKITNLPACEEASEETEALLRFWEKEKRQVALSVSLHTTESMTLALCDLKYAVLNGDARFFERSRHQALAAAEGIRNAESFATETWV